MTRSDTEAARILFAVSSMSAGGAERVISELANSFVHRYQAVGVLTLSPAHSDHYSLDPRIERIALDILWESKTPWETIKGNLRRNARIRAAVRCFRPDALVSFIEQTNVRILAAATGLGVPVVVSERIDPRKYDVGRAWNLARRLTYPLASRVVVQSEAVAGWGRSFLQKDRVRVIPNFVRDLPAPATARSPLDILAVGRLDEQKGFDLLLRAFSATGLANDGFRLTILGEGPKRSLLEALANELGIANSVLMPGIVADPEVWMARSAIFVLSSRFEGFPNVLLEAMAMGCAVIATDCESGPAEIVQDGINGLLVPADDVEALSQAILRLTTHSSLREAISAEAVNVRSRYSKAVLVKRWEDLICEVTQE